MAERLPIKSVTVGLLVFTVSGCSTMKATPPHADPLPLRTPVATTLIQDSPPPHCAIAQRDLTRAWNRRRYWCRPEGIVLNEAGAGTPVVRVAAGEQQAAVPAGPASPASAHTPPPVAPGQSNLEPRTTVRIHRVASAVSPAPGPVYSTPLSDRSPVAPHPTQSVPQQPTPQAVATTYTIPFARTAVALGPVGRHQAQALLSAARAHCVRSQTHKCLLLQGATLGPARETNPVITDPDELAVGRALAVRAILEQGGIAQDRIKILSRDPSQVARQVEVRLDG